MYMKTKPHQMNISIVSLVTLKSWSANLLIYTRHLVWETGDMILIHRGIPLGLIIGLTIHHEKVEWPTKFQTLDLADSGVVRWRICIFSMSDLCSPSELRSISLMLFCESIPLGNRMFPQWSHLPVGFDSGVSKTKLQTLNHHFFVCPQRADVDFFVPSGVM